MKRSPMMEMIGLGRARSLLKRRTPVESSEMSPSRRHGYPNGPVDGVKFRVELAELRIRNDELIEKRSDPRLGARAHVRENPDIDRSHHRRARSAEFLPRQRSDIRIEGGCKNDAHRSRTRGASAQPHFTWDRAGSEVAVARREGEAFEHRTRQAGEAGPG